MSEQAITDMEYEEYLSLMDTYIERSTREDDEMPASVFFELLFKRMAEQVTETIELEVDIVDNQLVLQLPEGAVKVNDNEILVGNQRIVVKLRGGSYYSTAQ